LVYLINARDRMEPNNSLRFCAQGSHQLVMKPLNFNCASGSLKWLRLVKHGFTDGKWFRLFGADSVFIFEHHAVAKPGTPVKWEQVRYDNLLICYKGKESSPERYSLAC